MIRSCLVSLAFFFFPICCLADLTALLRLTEINFLARYEGQREIYGLFLKKMDPVDRIFELADIIPKSSISYFEKKYNADASDNDLPLWTQLLAQESNQAQILKFIPQHLLEYKRGVDAVQPIGPSDRYWRQHQELIQLYEKYKGRSLTEEEALLFRVRRAFIELLVLKEDIDQGLARPQPTNSILLDNLVFIEPKATTSQTLGELIALYKEEFQKLDLSETWWKTYQKLRVKSGDKTLSQIRNSRKATFDKADRLLNQSLRHPSGKIPAAAWKTKVERAKSFFEELPSNALKLQLLSRREEMTGVAARQFENYVSDVSLTEIVESEKLEDDFSVMKDELEKAMAPQPAKKKNPSPQPISQPLGSCTPSPIASLLPLSSALSNLSLNSQSSSTDQKVSEMAQTPPALSPSKAQDEKNDEKKAEKVQPQKLAPKPLNKTSSYSRALDLQYLMLNHKEEKKTFIEALQKALGKKKQALFELFFNDKENDNQISYEEVRSLITTVKNAALESGEESGTFRQRGTSHLAFTLPTLKDKNEEEDEDGTIVLPGGMSFANIPHGAKSGKTPKLRTFQIKRFRRAFEQANITPKSLFGT